MHINFSRFSGFIPFLEIEEIRPFALSIPLVAAKFLSFNF